MTGPTEHTASTRLLGWQSSEGRAQILAHPSFHMPQPHVQRPLSGAEPVLQPALQGDESGLQHVIHMSHA